MAWGKHLFPFRTEQLSPTAPMVLGSQGPGRVGRRRFNMTIEPLLRGGSCRSAALKNVFVERCCPVVAVRPLGSTRDSCSSGRGGAAGWKSAVGTKEGCGSPNRPAESVLLRTGG